jgi:hypothetical protein
MPSSVCIIFVPLVCCSSYAHLTHGFVFANSIDKEKNAPPKHYQTHQQHECRKAEDEAFKWTGKLNAIGIKQIKQLLTNTNKKGVIHL